MAGPDIVGLNDRGSGGNVLGVNVSLMRLELALRRFKTLTKDRRYDSNDSREIVKGSVSFKTARWFDEVEVRDLLLPQKAFFSSGDGWEVERQ